MANICWYQIKVTGKKKNAHMVYHTTPSMDFKYISEKKGGDEEYLIIYSGDCKWSLDAYCEDNMNNITLNIDEYVDNKGNQLKDLTDYWYYTMLEKSKFYNCEIEIFQQFEDYNIVEDYGDRPVYLHYKNGKTIEYKTLSFKETEEQVKEKFNMTIDNPYFWQLEEEDTDITINTQSNTESLTTYNELGPDFPIITELTNTQLHDGIERAEHYQVGDEIKLIPEPDNEYDSEAIRAEHKLGFVGYVLCDNDYLLQYIKEDENQLKAYIKEVIPLSQRSKRCKKPLVTIEIIKIDTK